jgi:predicted acyl esterase
VTAGYAQQLKDGLAPAIGTFPDLRDAPPTLTYEGPTLTAAQALDMTGVPRFHLQAASADALPAGVRGGAAAFQLDPKLYDVAPDGTATLVTRGAFAEPLNGQPAGTSTRPAHAVDFDAFGLSYRIGAGHHLRITLSTEDAPYLRPTVNPFAVALLAGSAVDLPSSTRMFPTPPLG